MYRVCYKYASLGECNFYEALLCSYDVDAFLVVLCYYVGAYVCDLKSLHVVVCPGKNLGTLGESYYM